MKKRLLLVLFAILLGLSSCSVQRFSDVKMFERKFNKQFTSLRIDSGDALITKLDDETCYGFIMESGGISLLICLYADNSSLNIKRCTVTAAAEPEAMRAGGFDEFRSICAAVTTAFSNGEDTPQEIEELVLIPESEGYTPAVAQYGETLRNRYVYSADNDGAYFSARSKELNPETIPELTLRSYGGYDG